MPPRVHAPAPVVSQKERTENITKQLGLVAAKVGKHKNVALWLAAWDLAVPSSIEKDPDVRTMASTVRVRVWHGLKFSYGCYQWQQSIWVVPNEWTIPAIRALFEEAEKDLKKVGLDATIWQILPIVTTVEVKEAIGKSMADGFVEELARYFDSFSEAMENTKTTPQQKLANVRRLLRNLVSVDDIWNSESDQFRKIDPETRKKVEERIGDLKQQLEQAVEALAPPEPAKKT